MATRLHRRMKAKRLYRDTRLYRRVEHRLQILEFIPAMFRKVTFIVLCMVLAPGVGPALR